MKILVIDDDPVLLEQLGNTLKNQGYTVEVLCRSDEALERLFENVFDLVVLDIMMPGIDGLSLLREMRKSGIAVPVLMLSAKGDTDDKIRGLDYGADDYLPKPFSLDELTARVRALLRRNGRQGDPVLQAGELRLDTVAHTATRSGLSLELTPREFSILEFLLYNKNRVVTRFNLAEHVWQDDFDPFSMSNFMDVHIKNLRRKIGEGVVLTVRGIGYTVKDPER